MECPKCGLEIDDKAMVCPNCKKVLKLACPVCKTINTTNICKTCGFVIISKCHNCGKINQTISKKCRNCGFETEKSVLMNEANCDDYVLLSINFPNLSEMKNLLGSAKLYNKFKINLDKIIADYAKSVGLRRQIIKETYTIRCYKDYTFANSTATAIKAAIEIINRITAMNCKLTKKKNSSIKCNIFLQKRNLEDDPYDINSLYNINLISQNAKKQEDKILETFQVLCDSDVAEQMPAEYKIEQLNSVLVKGKMTMIYEVDVKDSIVFEFPEDENEVEIPNFVQNMLVEQDKLDGEALDKMNSFGKDPDSIYDIDTIKFDEVKCEFIRTENIDVDYHVMNKLQTTPNGILAIKTPEMYKPYTLKMLNAVAETGKYENIITLTCYDEMKYVPYAFFRDLISAIFEYTVSQKLFFNNDFSMFANVDPDGLIRDLITLNCRNEENTEDTRYVYYDIFLTMLKVIPKTLIYIEDFEKIDSSSYDVLKYLFEAFDKLDISFLISYDKEFSLHKDCHFLLMQPYYTEITLKPTSFEKMIENNKVYYKNILGDFYFQRIAKYACGSSLYIDMALQYLLESGVYFANEETIKMVNPKTILIPSNLDKLVSRRLNLLQDDKKAMKFFTSIILLGTRIDKDTIASLEYKDSEQILERLSDMGLIYEYNNCIYFPNYNLLRRNLLSTISKIYLDEVASELFEKVYNDADMPSPEEAYLYSLLKDKEKERSEWENLARVSLSLGDHNAYINCTERIINLLDEVPENAEYKTELYENIAESFYESISQDKISLAEVTLENIEKTSHTEKIIRLCNKMINSALNTGDYTRALELMHKVLSLLPLSSVNPKDLNFNPYFFLMSAVHVRILLNIGALTDCIDVGHKVLNYVSNETIEILKPEYFEIEDFKNFITDIIGNVAFANVLLMLGNVQEFIDIMRKAIDCIPKSYDLFSALQNVMRGINVPIPEVEIAENDRYGWILYNIISAFRNFDGNYNKFAEYIYKAKIAAKNAMAFQLELFMDLIIGYSYMKVGSYEKAEYIVYNIIKVASAKGMTTLLYAAWYVMSEIHLLQDKYDVAFGIINNSLIQIERNANTSEFILMLFKYNMYKVLMYKKQYVDAEICLNHAKYIANKYSIKYKFDTDMSHYVSRVLPGENDLTVNPMLDAIYPGEPVSIKDSIKEESEG